MYCSICKKDKLSNEYPPIPATDKCDHFSCICLRCTVKSLQGDDGRCPEPECSAKAEPNSKRLKLFLTILDKQFPDLEVFGNTSLLQERDKDDKHKIYLTLLNGESREIEYTSTMSIKDLKKVIKKDLSIETDKQRLFYKQQELLVYKNENYEEYTLDEYGIEPFSTLHLIHIRFTLSPKLEDVVYEIHWGYPESENFLIRNLPGFLKNWFESDIVDGTCILFKKSELFGRVNSKTSNDAFKGISHTGSQLSHNARKGFQKLQVEMNNIDQHITSLYFVLSARRAPNIHVYPDKQFDLYDKKNPKETLCKINFDSPCLEKSRSTLAIILCSVTKNKDDIWEVREYGEPCAGNVDDYKPIENRIKELVQQGF